MAGFPGKGNWNEWETARALSLWLTDGADKTQLVRSSQSGGNTRLRDKSFSHVGDLAPNGIYGEKFRSVFGVECKNSSTDPDWWHSISSKKWCVQVWWNKIHAECAPHQLTPLLIMKRNSRPVVVMLEHDLYQQLAFIPDIVLPRLDAVVITLEVFKAISPEAWYMAAHAVRPYNALNS